MSEKRNQQAADENVKPRTCQACGVSYSYPLAGSAATRFHCETCASLPANVRQTFERLSKRIKSLETELNKMK